MNAMIFAAGLGTRLAPLTNKKPKALVEIENKTLLEIAINKISRAGVKRLIINVHHFGGLMIDYIRQMKICDVEIVISDEREKLMDTGGGLIQAKNLFIKNEPILLYNTDVVSNINLREIIGYHNEKQNFATLFVQNRNSARKLVFDMNNLLIGREKIDDNNNLSNNKLLCFNGIHVVDYSITELFGQNKPFSIIDGYISLVGVKKIAGWQNDDIRWFDVGTIAKLETAKNYLTSISEKDKLKFFE